MKLKPWCLATALVLSSSLSIAAAPAGSTPVAKVNNIPVPSAFAELLTNEQLAQGATNNEALRTAVREELIHRELLAQEAKKAGIEKRADVAIRLDMARQGVLIGAYINEFGKAHPITEQQIRAEYDRRLAAMSQTEYKVRHIQFDKIEDAQAAIAKLQSGAKFEDLAKDSLDTGSSSNGGDIGWVSPLGVPKPFGDAITKLASGKYTTVPVQTQYGFHVIKVDETRVATAPDYQEKKGDLRQYLEQQALTAHIDELAKKAKIE